MKEELSNNQTDAALIRIAFKAIGENIPDGFFIDLFSHATVLSSVEKILTYGRSLMNFLLR